MNKNRDIKKFYDYSLVVSVLFLIAFGLIMIYSSSSYFAQLKMGNSTFYLNKQIVHVIIGLVVMVLVSLINYKFILKASIPLYIISVLLLIAVLAIGKEVHGSKRWLEISGLSIQPSEVAKLALILSSASLIKKIGRQVNEMQGFYTVGVITIPLVMLVMPNNLSTAIIMFFIPFIMHFVATRGVKLYAALLAILIIVYSSAHHIAYFLYKINVIKEYQYTRVLVWKHPEQYSLEGGYQVLQGLYAVGSGGAIGKGLGEGMQKIYIPEAQNDMIFSIICEELGLFGAVSIIIIFSFLLYRCFVIAKTSSDIRAKLLVTGIMAHIGLQVVFNISVVTGLVPNTGISLPFISYGGTALVLMMTEIGIVLSVGRAIPMEY